MSKVKPSYPQRVQFPVGKQHEFLEIAQGKIDCSLHEIAALLKVSDRTLRDWKQEKFHMSLVAVQKLCSIANISLPTMTIKEPFWYASKGAMRGWQVILRKYGRVPGNPEYRQQKWREWWEREGRYQKHPIINISTPIKKARFSKNLAEFVGIMMGDGGIGPYQLTVSSHSVVDREYVQYVKRLIETLFDVPVTIFRPSTPQQYVRLVISRSELVKYCHSTLGLKIGNKLKQGLDIPQWIKDNVEYQKACVRGLIDTDGCVFYERHRIKNKIYSYPRLNFVSHSLDLLKSVFTILKDLGFSPRERGGRCVQLENKAEILHYFDTIGSHNPKHKDRLLAQ